MNPFPWAQIWVLTGPTGSGKTQLGLEMAAKLRAEIVSMDSMALFRGMDIGTAKPSRAERQRVPHHLVDVLDPWESASVAWWLAQAAACVQDIIRRGRRGLFVGGTPLYLKALLRGLFSGPPADEDLRQRLTQQAQEVGLTALHQRLGKVDPQAAVKIHVNDQRRIIRALEVFELTGKPISAWQTQWEGVKSEGLGVRGQGSGVMGQGSDVQEEEPGGKVLWLDCPREELYERINRRVETMFAEGLVEEVRALCRLELPLSREARQALGYKEVLEHLAGQRPLAETITLVQCRTRQFAKRQISWFRHLPECQKATAELTRQLWDPTMKNDE